MPRDGYVDADLGLLERGLRAVDDVAEDSACLYTAMLTERDLLDEVTSAEIDRAVRAWRAGFAGLLRPALAAAGVRGGPDVEAFLGR